MRWLKIDVCGFSSSAIDDNNEACTIQDNIFSAEYSIGFITQFQRKGERWNGETRKEWENEWKNKITFARPFVWVLVAVPSIYMCRKLGEHVTFRIFKNTHRQRRVKSNGTLRNNSFSTFVSFPICALIPKQSPQIYMYGQLHPIKICTNPSHSVSVDQSLAKPLCEFYIGRSTNQLMEFHAKFGAVVSSPSYISHFDTLNLINTLTARHIWMEFRVIERTDKRKHNLNWIWIR